MRRRLQRTADRSYGETVTDPEDVTELRPADLAETGVTEIPDDERPVPLEADPADVSEQRLELADDDDLYDIPVDEP